MLKRMQLVFQDCVAVVLFLLGRQICMSWAWEPLETIQIMGKCFFWS